MLGPERESFHGNRGSMLAWTLVIAAPALYIGHDLRLARRPAEIFFAVAAGLILLMVGWIASVRVGLHNDGLSYRSWFSSREIRWENLERFYWSSVKRSYEYVPLGTYYLFRFHGVDGARLRFGNRVGRLRELSRKLAEATYTPLYKQAAEDFNRGLDVDFGDIKINKTQGLRVRRYRLFGWARKTVEIPWDQVRAYNIQKGHFYVWRTGEKKVSGPLLRNVPNAFVLKGLLDNLLRPAATPATPAR